MGQLAWWSKREAGGKDAAPSAPQDPHDMAKAGLLKVQSQVVYIGSPSLTASNSDADPYVGDVRSPLNLRNQNNVTSVGLTTDNESD
jgi:hypothetical protein